MTDPTTPPARVTPIQADRARELLAQAYEAGGPEGPYPTYAELARTGTGAFTMCSLRAIEAALSEREQAVREALDAEIDPIVEELTKKALAASAAQEDRLRQYHEALKRIAEMPPTMIESGKQLDLSTLPCQQIARAALAAPKAEAHPVAGEDAEDLAAVQIRILRDLRDTIPDHDAPARGALGAAIAALAHTAPDALAEMREFVDNFFAPWGSWKTEWWEHISKDRPYNADVALDIVRSLLATEGR